MRSVLLVVLMSLIVPCVVMADPLRVMLDAGHGGIDPGAERDGVTEADLMLQFVQELRAILEQTGTMDVLLTRSDDSYISLPGRVTAARTAQADVFLSFHADALSEGRATGAAVYTLSKDASDAASAGLAASQERRDVLAGVDLTALDDQIAQVVIDMARRETTPRSNMLADHIVTAMQDGIGGLYKKPRLQAGFSVLKAPDIPSVLIELGFLSSQSDAARLSDPVWRTKAARAIALGLQAWARDDADLRAKLRQ